MRALAAQRLVGHAVQDLFFFQVVLLDQHQQRLREAEVTVGVVFRDVLRHFLEQVAHLRVFQAHHLGRAVRPDHLLERGEQDALLDLKVKLGGADKFGKKPIRLAPVAPGNGAFGLGEEIVTPVMDLRKDCADGIHGKYLKEVWLSNSKPSLYGRRGLSH